jgi:hypothetical protein
MASTTAQSVRAEAERAELHAVLQSELFARSPALAHLLSYLCEKQFAGEGDQIKEYSIALDVFRRGESFDQDADSIVRVQANRLRKRLAEYYSGEGAAHHLHITIPVGQYVPVFEQGPFSAATPEAEAAAPVAAREQNIPATRRRALWLLVVSLAALAALAIVAYLTRERPSSQPVASSSADLSEPMAEPPVGLPVGNEIRILAGADHRYVDRAGKLWNPDSYFTGGTRVRSPIQYIWRTQDPIIYRTSRQGDFTYDIPLKPGTYELHLHFAETYYGPEDMGGGGEGSRVMTISANGKPLLTGLDVVADSGGARTADVTVFTDIGPADDGLLHLSVASVRGGRGMLSGIEILPGTRGHIRPVRIVARDVPYYSNDSRWWSPDVYFKGGRLTASEQPAAGTDDPELYETERWGHFSYAIPVTPGKYNVVLHFIERSELANHDKYAGLSSDSGETSKDRVFNVFCNGQAILSKVNILDEVGEDHPLVRKITGLEPDAQGKLLLEFVPVNHYATISAIEVLSQ